MKVTPETGMNFTGAILGMQVSDGNLPSGRFEKAVDCGDGGDGEISCGE